MQTTEIAPSPGNRLPLAHFARRVEEYARASRAENTLRGYRSDWAQFGEWCGAVGLAALPALPETIGGALCPVRALLGWLEASAITSGPVFRGVTRHGHIQPGRLTDQVVASVVKACTGAAGLDSAKYAGHSLRAGLVTQAAINGVHELAIMRQTRHKSSDMLRKYIRDASLFRDNASARIGL